MQIRSINNIYQSSRAKTFGSNTGSYKTKDGNCIETYTKMFRTDLDWQKFTDFMVKHFKDKDKVQIIQFASSDGSEAYTQIISLLENHKEQTQKFFPIEAFDIDSDILKAAKSGLLNINFIDKIKFRDFNINFDKYFRNTNSKIEINNDKLPQSSAYKVSEELTNRVNFHNKDMFEVIKGIDDKSNTVIMCRNVLNYLTDREIDSFTSFAAFKLKKGSLFVIGEYDNPRVDNFLKEKGFIKVMDNVYMQS